MADATGLQPNGRFEVAKYDAISPLVYDPDEFDEWEYDEVANFEDFGIRCGWTPVQASIKMRAFQRNIASFRGWCQDYSGEIPAWWGSYADLFGGQAIAAAIEFGRTTLSPKQEEAVLAHRNVQVGMTYARRHILEPGQQIVLGGKMSAEQARELDENQRALRQAALDNLQQ